MKKAKIILATIAVLAVIGGAFAFNTQKFGEVTYWTTATSYVDDNGVTYTAAQPFCTLEFFNTSPTLPLIPVATTATIPATKTVTTLTNTAGATITLPYFTCGQTVLRNVCPEV